ncbi:MAG: preprotein translocase subunit SecA [Candidatus Omnitrophica bacterium]|nr:preprotein translocase subunit SecA [Candidatus Omnitrophota bacterium]
MFRAVLESETGSGIYPEKKPQEESWLEKKANDFFGRLTLGLKTRRRRSQAFVERVNRWSEEIHDLTDEALKERIDPLRSRFRKDGVRWEHAAFSFALIREFSERLLGLRHFDVQLMGGWIILNGMIAEMETGEGKTLTALLPACTAALAGVPVHIITVNDYLAKRDAEWMKPVYEAFGLPVGIVTHEKTFEDRFEAYRRPITYCTNKEVVFDYLKDRLIAGPQSNPIQLQIERLHNPEARFNRLRLRGLYFAIVDEADSILIDEARTPLIISGQGKNTYENQVYRQALDLAQQFEDSQDFVIDRIKRSLELTDEGKHHLSELTESLGGFWKGRQWREELISQALTALHLFFRDKDYLVRDGKVQIVDEFTGRVMGDRSWERGLHQLIEVKEDCEITSQNETLTRISYQRFFRRYLILSGMTGTAREVARELWSVYHLRVIKIPTNKPLIRRRLPTRFFIREETKRRNIVERIKELHQQGRPVLVGTRSVAASEHFSRLLTQSSLPHRILNARQDQEEAAIIAQAGRLSQITVATNMAGRGTDIRLDPQAIELGGLHVIASEPHEARRIDRQLFGRCGRQGDPGSYELFASLEDDILLSKQNSIFIRWFKVFLAAEHSLCRSLSRRIIHSAQRRVEHKHYIIRGDLLRYDEAMENVMAFSGRRE